MIDVVTDQGRCKDQANLYDCGSGSGKYFAEQQIFCIHTGDKNLDGSVAFFNCDRGGNHDTVQDDHHKDHHNKDIAVPVIIAGILSKDLFGTVDRSIVFGGKCCIIQALFLTVKLLMYLGKKSLEDHLILVVHITVYHIIIVIQIILDIKAGRHIFCFHGFFQLFFCLHSNDVGILKGLFQNRHVTEYAGFINNADLCFILFVCFCFIGGIRVISGLCGSLFDAKHI